MITRRPSTVTKIQSSNAMLRNRILTAGQSSDLPVIRTETNQPAPAPMGTLQHLCCGCLGVSCLAMFMGAINLMVQMMFQQCSSFNLNELLWMLGH